jgi:hypothetical protein
MGIRDKLIAPASPWQNGFADIVVWGEGHLRRILRAFACYYNNIRTRRPPDKDAPAFLSIQRIGIITSCPILDGFITATVGFEFSVHTARPRCDGRRELIQLYHRARNGRRAGAW